MGDLTLNIGGELVDVVVHKVKPKALVSRPNTVKVDANTGKEIEKKRMTETGDIFNSYHYIYVDSEDNQVSKENVIDMVKDEDGNLKEIEKLTKTNVVSFDDDHIFPANYTHLLFPDGVYQLEPESDKGKSLLIEKAEECWDEDKSFAVNQFVWRKGYSQYYAVFYPEKTDEGNVRWLLKTTKGRLEYNEEYDLKTTEEKEKAKVKKLPNIMEVI